MKAATDKIWWVSFTSKGDFKQPIEQIFDAKAIERRYFGNIAFDESDIPINAEYIKQVSQHSIQLIGASKWLNACAIVATDLQVLQIKNLPFVAKVNEVIIHNRIKENNLSLIGKSRKKQAEESSMHSKKIVMAQQASMGLKKWQTAGIDGKGIRIAVFDAGFPNVDKHPCFKHLWENKRIVATRNFLKRNENVFGRNFHGEAVLSCITGNNNGELLGVAQSAEFLLAITEYGMREPFREELFWLMAAEWADEKGADIISSSLGYGFERYFFRDMDGNTSLVSKAAGKAASKGILVINSAGNEGTDAWKMIITPADNDSVLAVGGVSPLTGWHINFSSFGPNYKGKVKPNLCAPGDVMAARGLKITNIQGTSFSCPLIAGFAACLLQFKPELRGKPLASIKFLEENSTLFPYYDFAHGYGIPDAGLILAGKKEENKASFILRDDAVKKGIVIQLNQTDTGGYLIDSWQHSLYLKMLNEKNEIIEYQLFSLQPDVKEIEVKYGHLSETFSMEVHYAGTTKKIVLNHFSH